jgi:hypothetical protein
MINTMDLLIPASSDQLLWYLKKKHFSFFTKQAISIRRSTVQMLSLQQEFSGLLAA